MLESILNFLSTTGIAKLFGMEPLAALKCIAMIFLSFAWAFISSISWEE